MTDKTRSVLCNIGDGQDARAAALYVVNERTITMRALLLASAAVLLPFAAHATFIVGDVADTKIFFNKADDASAFTGNVAKNNTGDLVNFGAVGLVDASNGFANINPSITSTGGNGDFTKLTITPTVQDWSAFTFRGQFGSFSTTDNLTLSVTDQFNTTQTFAFNGLAGPDTDFGDIGIVSTDNERIKSLTILAGAGDNFKELKQFEVQLNNVACTGADCSPPPPPPPPTPTPEPGSLLLLGTIGSALGGWRLFRHRRAA
jgi:hypothetical protein